MAVGGLFAVCVLIYDSVKRRIETKAYREYLIVQQEKKPDDMGAAGTKIADKEKEEEAKAKQSEMELTKKSFRLDVIGALISLIGGHWFKYGGEPLAGDFFMVVLPS